MPTILDIDAFCKDLPEITSSKRLDKKKFHPNGLHSEQIFGPVKNYTCQCGTYFGISRVGEKCKICGVEIISSDERRKRFAKIALPIPVINPLFYDLLIDLAGSKWNLKSTLDSLLKNEKSILFRDGDEYGIWTEKEKIDASKPHWERMEAVKELVSGVATLITSSPLSAKFPDRPAWEFIKNNVDKMFLNNVLVLPPDLRPATKEETQHKVDEINKAYGYILTKREEMLKSIIDVYKDKVLYYTYLKQLQREVNYLYDYIIEKLSKKEGLIRGNILGKRTDFSGRAVIVPDPTLNLDECFIPYLMFLELFKLQLSKKLIELDKFKLLNESVDYIDECIKLKDMALFKLCEEMAKGEFCLLNRQPSLHRLSLIGFKIKVTSDDVIKIHPLVCSGFNADFDGDQMAVYIPISKEAKDEILTKFIITENLTNPANGSLSTLPSQDIILGVYTLTAGEFKNLQNTVEYKGKTTTESCKIFNECLPGDYPLIEGPVNKKILINILSDIKEKYPDEVTKESLDNIKNLGYKYATLFGPSLSLDMCRIENSDEIKEEIYSFEDVKDQLAKVSSKETEDFLKKNFAYSYMVESGARGSWDQVRQIVLTRGFISNFKGQILEVPIKNSLIDGLTQEEFFNSTYGCRKGLLDVALNTGASGYLSRKLVFACANLQISETLEDCGTKDTLEVYVNSPKKARLLVGKYFISKQGKIGKITKENHEEFIGKTIFVRSPIFCESEQVCHICYGDYYKNLHSKFIGIIAAQSLGETNTQLILRTFHTSGVAVVKDKEYLQMQQGDIIGDLSTASNLLHQVENTNYIDLTHSLFDVYNTTREIYHVHFECVTSQLMWSGHKKWRLLKDRDKVAPNYCSVQSAPSRESWLLGFAFSNPKRHILKGILHSGDYRGIIDKILCGEKV